jgi:hypothetical protein
VETKTKKKIIKVLIMSLFIVVFAVSLKTVLHVVNVDLEPVSFFAGIILSSCINAISKNQ